MNSKSYFIDKMSQGPFPTHILGCDELMKYFTKFSTHITGCDKLVMDYLKKKISTHITCCDKLVMDYLIKILNTHYQLWKSIETFYSKKSWQTLLVVMNKWWITWKKIFTHTGSDKLVKTLSVTSEVKLFSSYCTFIYRHILTTI